jgi:hypothetical protein
MVNPHPIATFFPGNVKRRVITNILIGHLIANTDNPAGGSCHNRHPAGNVSFIPEANISALMAISGDRATGIIPATFTGIKVNIFAHPAVNTGRAIHRKSERRRGRKGGNWRTDE